MCNCANPKLTTNYVGEKVCANCLQREIVPKLILINSDSKKEQECLKQNN